MSSESRFRVTLGAGGVSFTATISVATGEGEATWHGSDGGPGDHRYQHIRREVVLKPFSPAELDSIREFVRQMELEGSRQYRDQFANAGISFSLDSDPPVTWDYQIDGGLPLDADRIYDPVARRVFAALDDQRAAERVRGPLLPAVDDEASLMTLHRDTEPWLAATRDVAKKHRLTGDNWVRAADGSQIVMLGDDAIIKFYVPFWTSIIDVEQAAMDLLRYEIDTFEIPKISGRGELDGWEYLVFSRVAGTPLREVELSDDESVSVARAVGEALRVLHEVQVPKDSILREVVPRWRSFLTDHRNRRGELERERGTPEVWTERLVTYLRSWRYRKRPTNTLLHADITHDHVMLRQVDGKWTFSGLIDFGDAKVGDPAYDFAAPFAFFTADRPDVRRAMLDGYGADDEILDRVFESLLLHEFGRLAALDLDGLESIEDVRKRYIDVDRS